MAQLENIEAIEKRLWKPERGAHLLRHGEKPHHHPARENESGGARIGGRHPESDQLLRRPARTPRQGRLRDV